MNIKNIIGLLLNIGILAAVLCLSVPAWGERRANGERLEAKGESESERREVVALKNNLLYDAAATPNLQLEVRLTDKWSLELGGGFNPFPLDDTKFPKWRHFSVWAAPRYWFCHVFNKGYLSFNAAYAHYNVAGGSYPIGWLYPQVKDNRYQGDAVMGGLSYGWHFAISPHFSIELEGGVDAGYSWYDQFECKHCGDKTASGGRWLVLPKVGVNLSVPLGGDERSFAKRCDCDTPQPPLKGEEEEPLVIDRIDVEPLVVPIIGTAAPVVASVPKFDVKADDMTRLRSRLLRSEEEYEPYNESMALSADPRNVFLFFDVNVTKMDRSFIQNDLLMDSIINILGQAMESPGLQITHIRIVGFASFDGKMAYNLKLAGSRAQTIKEYMQSIYPALNDSLFEVCNGGESWAELRYQLDQLRVKNEHLTEEEHEWLGEVLAIIDTEPDADIREKKIKALHGGKTYVFMRDELRYILRNLGCITIYVER